MTHALRRAAVLLLMFPALVQAQKAPLQGLDAYVNKAIAEWEVPGLGLAVIKNDTIVHSAGYGVKELGKPDKVTAQTIFAIGSASKAFTAALLGIAVDEGKVRWDDPAERFLQGFHINDPYASRELSLRDLLSHRSGLARGDLLWYAGGYERDSILHRVRFLEPTWSFRAQFGYQNIMYLAAGQAAAKIYNKSWDDLISERIFAPLGMSRSSTSVTRLKSMSDVSAPHARLDDKVRPVAWRNIDNIAPAGSINSSALDMAQWVRLQLNRGKVGDKTVLKPLTVREMHQPNTIIRRTAAQDSINPDTHLAAYGLGWFLEDYRGRLIVHHGGNIDGMSALVWMVPEEKLGVVILTNMNGSGLPNALAHQITDMYLGGGKKDWSATALVAVKEQQARAAQNAGNAERNRVKDTKPSLALDKYAGDYQNEMYGAMKIEHKDGKLWLKGPGAFSGELEHWHFDMFRIKYDDPMMGRAFATFVLDQQARPVTLRIDGLADYTRRFGPQQ